MNIKQIVIFLAVAQSILLALNLAVYWLLLGFFPALEAHKNYVLIVVLILAVSFLLATILSFKHSNFFLRLASIASSVWIVASFYFLLTSLAVLAAFSVFGGDLQNYGWTAFAVTATLTIYGIVNAQVIKITEVKISLPRLPDYWKGKLAILASDFHLGHILREGFAKKVVALINQHKPEVVLIPGDFFDSVHMDFQSMADEFKKINAPSGVYFSTGNHELYVNYKACEQALRNAGVNILENQKADVHGMQIAGVAYTADYIADLAQTLAAMGIDKNRPSILLKHIPQQLGEVEEAGFSLMLSGHTHHGQVWPGRYATKKVFKGYDYGLKKFKEMFVYTTSGVGTWGPPMRVFTKSEIVKIIFE